MYARESKRVSRSKSKNIHIERGVVATLRGVYHFPVKWVFSYYVGFSRLTMATAETGLHDPYYMLDGLFGLLTMAAKSISFDKSILASKTL